MKNSKEEPRYGSRGLTQAAIMSLPDEERMAYIASMSMDEKRNMMAKAFVNNLNENVMREHQERYDKLVERRKGCSDCMNCGLVNPSQIENGGFDGNEIGPWTRWQGSLTADIMIVGQDWGSSNEFIATEGIDRKSNSTDQMLIALLKELGIDVNFKEKNPRLFFTNAALCIREDGAQGGLNDEWLFNCRPYLKEQIEIVKPKVMIALGQKAFYAVLSTLNLPRKGKHNEKYSKIVGEPILYQEEYEWSRIQIFPVYHPGAYGRISRNFEKQKKDWQKIAQLIR